MSDKYFGAMIIELTELQCIDCDPGLSGLVHAHTRHVEWEAAHPLHVVLHVSTCTSLSRMAHKADYAPASAITL